ncbi:hypothetical protein HGRIS_014591 [Hohenbuehelia grisea]|uniref:Glycoside hydrolase family 71 protein n=1 Tax=Hohenbuehelia grisea TaxID=104357 RepID=A0ABR3JTX0_9AGAR
MIPTSFLLLFALLGSSKALTILPPVEAETAQQKPVVAHFMVGNTYPYTVNNWLYDIKLAASKGIDGFALNLGRDTWQAARVADAYAAAMSSNTGFKLFLSFDMTSLPCASPDDAGALQSYIRSYYAHPNQFRYAGLPLVSTFAGENCRFGRGSLDDAWASAVKPAGGMPVYFLPSFFVDPASFSGLPVMDGAFSWNSGWPMGNYAANFSMDTTYVSNLGGRSYMAAMSPWFFTHYGRDTYNKNWIFRFDDWLVVERWEQLLQHRDQVALVEIITWNDYGESHYIGPIDGAQPNSQSWVNGFEHQPWLDLLQYYIQAFKTGSFPPISRDRVFLWARLYPAGADAPDPVGRPDGWTYTQDILWGTVFLTAPADVTLSCGPSVKTMRVAAGVTKVMLPLVATCDVQAKVVRTNKVVVDHKPQGFRFRTDPPSYNFNAFVSAS